MMVDKQEPEIDEYKCSVEDFITISHHPNPPSVVIQCKSYLFKELYVLFGAAGI